MSRFLHWGKIGGVIVGGIGAVVAAPIIVGAIGFGAGGVVAGSIAAQMMSAAAIANGGAIAAGSTVAILQSVGAAGLGLAGALGVGAAGAVAGGAVGAVVDVGVAAARKGNADEVVIKIQVQEPNNVFEFSVMKDSPLQELFDRYCQQTNSNPDCLQFEFQGQPIVGSTTPAQLQALGKSEIVIVVIKLYKGD